MAISEIDLSAHPHKGEWNAYLVKIERLTDSANDLAKTTIQRALRIAREVTGGKMGVFLKAEKSKIPNFVKSISDDPSSFSVQIGYQEDHRTMKKEKIEVCSIRYHSGKLAKYMTVRLGENFTEISLAEGNEAKVVEIACQSHDELTFRRSLKVVSYG